MQRGSRSGRRQLVLGATAVGVLVVLHCLPGSGGVDPVHETLSEYPLRSVDVGLPYAIALLSANAATALLGAAMVRQGVLRGRLVTALLVIWCASLLGLTVFLKDPLGSDGTWYGTVHKLCAAVNFASLPALCGLLWWRFRRSRRWRAYARTVGVLAAATALCTAPFAAAFLLHGGHVAATGTALGLVERAVVALDAAMIATLAVWSRAMPAPPGTRAPARPARGAKRRRTTWLRGADMRAAQAAAGDLLWASAPRAVPVLPTTVSAARSRQIQRSSAGRSFVSIRTWSASMRMGSPR
ncbi:DUF998 domain-containing protein [Dactylosporangium sp. CA-152071]|uniref:DUF998 domain-containing protein n=1 Tax=Dactylosporangium sp. CA-152071 TaxID=3239933 RepID=UPI003D89C4EA